MTKRTTKSGLSQNDLNKITEIIKAETKKVGYGEAGTPLQANSKLARKRQVSAGENRYGSYSKTKTISNKDCEVIATANPILRTAIEYIKSGVSNTSYSFVDKNTNKETRAAKDLKNKFESPDSDNNFKSWLKQLVEDILVTDTATIYNEVNASNETLRVQIIDGTLIHPVVDARGIVPLQGTAYQMKVGKYVEDFTRDELIYHPTNKRTKEKYGFSKVAQAYKIAALFDKAMKDFDDYYDGNIANVVATIKGLDTVDIATLDALVGYYEEQRNNANKYTLATFPEADFHNLKQVDLKSDIHDFYIRIVCAIFNVPYQYFVSEVNRATAETAKDTTEQKGLRDILDSLEEIVNKIIRVFYKNNDVIFKFVIDVPVDPDKLATRLATLVSNKLITVNEARLELGYPAIDGGDVLLETATPSPQASNDGQADDQEQEDEDKDELKKSASSQDKVIADAFKESEEAMEALFASLLASQKEALLEAIKSGATINEDLLKRLEIDDAKVKEFLDEFSSISQKVSVTFVTRMNDLHNINSIKAFDEAIEKLTSYNTERATALLGKKLVDGLIVDNPDSKFAITETTRDGVKTLIDKAMQSGMSNQALAAELESSFDFSKERANKIAVSETNSASNYTSLVNYEAAGVDEVVWSTTYNDKALCKHCLANEKQGPIAIGKAFSSGAIHPPAHPGCRCTLNPFIKPKK